MKQSRIVITADGLAFAETVSLVPITGASALLRSTAVKSALLLPALTPNTWMVYEEPFFTAFTRIFQLRLNCNWKIVEEKTPKGEISSFLQPSFRGSEGATDTLSLRDYTWKVPDDMALLFVSTKLKGSSTVLTAKKNPNFQEEHAIHGTLGLIALDLKTRKLYRLPLPNTFEDGHLCPGDLNCVNGYAYTAANGIFGSWSENRWNSDLIGSTRDHYKELVRLDPKSGETLPSGKPWQELCFQISTGAWLSNTALAEGIKNLK